LAWELLSLEVASALQRESRRVDLGAVWGRPELAYPSEQVGVSASLEAPLSPFAHRLAKSQ